MSNENDTSTEATESQVEQTSTEQTAASEPDKAEPTLDELRNEVEKWKSLSRKHESSAKANSEAAQKLQEYEDAQKSETQRLNDQLASAQQRVAELEVKDSRSRAAKDAGLDADMAEYLTAADYDSAYEQAARLAEKVAPKQKPADLKQGTREPAKQSDDPNEFLRKMIKG